MNGPGADCRETHPEARLPKEVAATSAAGEPHTLRPEAWAEAANTGSAQLFLSEPANSKPATNTRE